MENLTKNFLVNQNEETFSLIEECASALNDVFKFAPDLADKFFQFKHWHLLYRKWNNSQIFHNKMQNSVKTFDEGFDYYRSLDSKDMEAYCPELIKLANSVKDLKATHHLIGNKYRQEIVEKMRKVAVTEEDQKDVNRYERC